MDIMSIKRSFEDPSTDPNKKHNALGFKHKRRVDNMELGLEDGQITTKKRKQDQNKVCKKDTTSTDKSTDKSTDNGEVHNLLSVLESLSKCPELHRIFHPTKKEEAGQDQDVQLFTESELETKDKPLQEKMTVEVAEEVFPEVKDGAYCRPPKVPRFRKNQTECLVDSYLKPQDTIKPGTVIMECDNEYDYIKNVGVIIQVRQNSLYLIYPRLYKSHDKWLYGKDKLRDYFRPRAQCQCYLRKGSKKLDFLCGCGFLKKQREEYRLCPPGLPEDTYQVRHVKRQECIWIWPTEKQLFQYLQEGDQPIDPLP